MIYSPFSGARRDGKWVRVMAFALAAIVGAQIGWIVTLQQELNRSYVQIDRAIDMTKDTMVTLALYRQKLDRAVQPAP